MMANRGRVVIDLLEESPPPGSQRQGPFFPQRIPESRFITPSDDSDDSVEILWDTRKGRHDTSVSNTLKSNVIHLPQASSNTTNTSKPHDTKASSHQKPSTVPPTNNAHNAKKRQTPAIAQSSPVRPHAPNPTIQQQRPAQPLLPTYLPPASRHNPVSITNPLTKRWLLGLSKSEAATPPAPAPHRPALPPNATLPSLSSTAPVPSQRFQVSQPSQLSGRSRPSPSTPGVAPQSQPLASVGLRDATGSFLSQPLRPTQSCPASIKEPFAQKPSPSNALPRMPPAKVPQENHGIQHFDCVQSTPLTPHVYPIPPSSEHAGHKLEPSTMPATTVRSAILPPPSSIASLKVPSPTSSPPPMHRASKELTAAADGISSAVSRTVGSDSPRMSKRRLETVEDDDDYDEGPVKRSRRERPFVAMPPGSAILTESGSSEDDVVRSIEVDKQPEDTHTHFSFPTDLSKIQPFGNNYGRPFTPKEDALIKHLKEVAQIPWKDFERFFPGRKWPSMQTRYSKVLKNKTGLIHSPAKDVRDSIRDHPAREPRRTTHAVTSHAPTRSIDSSVALEEETAEPLDDPVRCRRTNKPLSYLVRHRELGATHGREWPKKFQAGVRDIAYSSMGVQAYMDNASGDVSTIAWSPDGKLFAAGAVAVTDIQSIDYNKPRNLVVGSAATRRAKELPQHTVRHTLPDLRHKDLFSTVQMVAFSPCSKRMYSVGIDKQLHSFKVDKSPSDTTLLHTFTHSGSVDFLSVSNDGRVATGCASTGHDAISVLSFNDDDTFSLDAQLSGKPKTRKYPSALRWGATQYHGHFLLAGFSRETEVVFAEDDSRDKEGEVALWDMNHQARLETDAPNRNVFDLTWNPNPGSSIFAVASRPFGHVAHGIHSVVRLYSPNESDRAQHTIELDCPAIDINDVIYSPHDSNLIAVGSTEGRVYIWDVRYTKRGESPLSTLKHGESIAVLPFGKKRYEADTGIRFLSWGAERDRLYSGSSDGVVSCWDPYRSDSDKHVRDVVRLNSAVMSGAFSPDFCQLLIGEDAARLNLLSIGNNKLGNEALRLGRRSAARFDVEAAAPLPEEDPPILWDCKSMLEDSALVARPVGVIPLKQIVQGPEYRGPYSSNDDNEKARKDSQKFQDKVLRTLQRRNRQMRLSGCKEVEACHLDCLHIPLPNAPLPRWEMEGNGRSDDRIPDQLWKKETRLTGSFGLGKCSVCGGSARRSGSGAIGALCEKCSFSCFRCDNAVTVSPNVKAIECESCDLAWKIGALGYDLIEQQRSSGNGQRGLARAEADRIDLMDSEDEEERFREQSVESVDSKLGGV